MNDVLIVDDELAVLGSLVNAVHWTEYGFKNVHTAQCAADALRLLKTHAIDLLISDILMPGMNGLDMLRLVRTEHPKTHCVIVSAHGKFEYCREALKMGVENFLLKPVDINELQETVRNAAENIARESDVPHDLFEKNVLERWLYGRISTDELVERSRYTCYNVLLRQYCAVLLHLPGLVRKAAKRMVSALVMDLCAYVLEVSEDQCIVLIGGREIHREAVHHAAVQTFGGYPEMRVACGTVVVGSGEVARSLTDATRTMEYAELSGRHGWADYAEVDWQMLPPEFSMQLQALLHAHQPDTTARRWAENVLNALQLEQSQIRALYAHVCLELGSILEDQAPEKKRLPFSALEKPWGRKQFVDAMARTITALIDFNQRSEQEIAPIVRRVIGYINQNLNGALSLKQFSEQTNMNATYIGRLFKEETGMYFSDYVCHKRITKAKHLLETTSLAVGDIGRQVGIYDVSYFTQCFKKQVGLSPMKFRQQRAKDVTP